MTRAAVYARVSTTDQQPESQLLELRRYVEARGWTLMREYVDHGVFDWSDLPDTNGMTMAVRWYSGALDSGVMKVGS